MHVVLIGASHRTAPLEVRERLALTAERQRSVLAALRAGGAVEEAAVLSTCNRLEVYAVLGHYHDGIEALADLLARSSGMEFSSLTPYLYVRHHHEVARHLFRVACGLESMVLGEAEVLGQVRSAFEMAREAGATGKVLNELFQRALKVGKRARAETGIGRHAASLSSAAVELARRRLGDLRGRVAVLVGAGEAAGLAVEPLKAAGARLVFINRTDRRAREMALRAGGTCLPWEERERAVARADLAIVSTAAPRPVITAAGLLSARAPAGVPGGAAQTAPAARGAAGAGSAGAGELLIIDLSVPRNVDPAVAQLPGVALFALDDLQEIVAEGLRHREREVPRVEALIQAEVEDFSRWLGEQQVVPLIRSLRQQAEEIRRREVERLLRRFPDLPPDVRDAIEAATAAMVQRILDEPTVRIKQAAARGEPYVHALSEVFALPVAGRRRAAATPGS